MFDNYPRERTDIQGIYLNQISRGFCLVVLRLAYSVGALLLASSGRDRSQIRLLQYTPGLKVTEDPTHCGSRDLPSFTFNQYYKLIFPPPRVLFPEPKRISSTSLGSHIGWRMCLGRRLLPSSPFRPYSLSCLCQRYKVERGRPKTSLAFPADRPCCLRACQQFSHRNLS